MNEVQEAYTIRRAKIKRISICSLSILILLLIGIKFFVIDPKTKYNNAIDALYKNDFDQAILLFHSLGNYSDSEVLLKESKFAKAQYLTGAGEYKAAYFLLREINDYRGVSSFIANNSGLVKIDTYFHQFNVGSVVEFGHYEQRYNVPGKEPIKWKVIKADGNRRLLLSTMILEKIPYYDYLANTTWEKSTIREWLNGEFYNVAFSSEEQGSILLTHVDNPGNKNRRSLRAKDTEDFVFLLSIDEVYETMPNWETRIAYPTEYAASQFGDNEKAAKMGWWTRSPGGTKDGAIAVKCDGDILDATMVSNGYYGARPAIWIDLSN